MRIPSVIAFFVVSSALPAFAGRELPLAFLQFDALYGSKNGDILAAEGFSGTRVFRISPDGVTAVAADGLRGPIDVADDDAGNLYVTNFNDATVSKVTPSGEETVFAHVLPNPSGIVRDSAGNFYVAHFGESDPVTGFGTGNVVLKITARGTVSTFSEGGLLAAPVGIAVDAHDTVYVANFHDGKVLSLARDGKQTLLADLTGPEISFAIGHIEVVNERVFATGLQSQELFRVSLRNGRVRTRDISDRVSLPNGLTIDPVTGKLLVARAFGPNATLVRFNAGAHRD
ncbi:MAG: hypothetical protein AAGJ56_06405 [Myxococcota bacterium]